MTVINFELRRSSCGGVPFAIEISNPNHVLKSLPTHGAGVHPQPTADGSRNSFHPFKTAQTRSLPRIRDLLEFGTRARSDFVSRYIHLIEITTAWMNHHATNSSIANEQV